jgi:RsiW-degrading membrane proteinase PrsW (M82 family)
LSRVRTVVATEILLVLGLLAFVGIAYAVEQAYTLDRAVRLSPLAAIAMSAVPAMLWLAYFYEQDRHEPEPKYFVFGVYLLGAFFAGPVAEFTVEQVMPVSAAPRTFDAFSIDRLVYAFLVLGLAQELCKYVAVRYTIYLSQEFDEPMDGIIYMTAAGIGFATYENYHYFMRLEGDILLTTGAAHAVVTTLAHACFAGVLGYALGRAKFSRARPNIRSLTLLLGLLAAVFLNGQFYLVESVIKTRGLALHPWRGVAYAAGFAAVIFFVTSLLMRRQLAISPFRPGADGSAPGGDSNDDSGETNAGADESEPPR